MQEAICGGITRKHNGVVHLDKYSVIKLQPLVNGLDGDDETYLYSSVQADATVEGAGHRAD